MRWSRGANGEGDDDGGLWRGARKVEMLVGDEQGETEDKLRYEQ